MPAKPTESEEEYFARLDLEKKKQIAARLQAEMAAAEREKLKALHWMRCPKCGSELTTIKLREVSVDTCPACEGMWLDAGEMEQLAANDQGGLVRKFRALFQS